MAEFYQLRTKYIFYNLLKTLQSKIGIFNRLSYNQVAHLSCLKYNMIKVRNKYLTN